MNSFWSGLLSMLTGGISSIFTNGGFDNLGNILNNAGDTASDLGNQNILGNYTAKMSGSRLTDAEREANAWTAEREDLAWQRSMEASNTVYQRQVADMQAAGLNPLMAASGNGSPAPSYSGGSSVTPGGASLNLGSLLQMAMQAKILPAQIANIKADTAVKAATASETAERERGSKIVNDFNQRTADDRAEGIKIANSLSSAQERSVYKGIDEMDAHIKQMLADASTAESRIALTWSQNILTRANARQVTELLPIEKAYKMAATDEARAAALLSAAHTAYQNKLINDGYVDALVKDLSSKASISFNESQLKAIKTALRTGEVPEGMDIGLKSHEPALKWFLQPLAIILDNYNPLNDLFK